MIANLLIRMRRGGQAVLIGLLLATGSAQHLSAEIAKGVPLTAEQQADLARIETYLNNLTTLQARFIQVSSTGVVAEGDVYLQRPGKVRFEYDPPVPVLIVSSGLVLYYYDKELEQTSQVFVRTTPIGILVRDKLSFSDDVTVSHFVRRAGTYRVTVQQTDDAEDGAITLIFSEAPLALRKWSVIDAQGTQTTVTLNNLQTGHALDPELFKFTEPTDNQ